MKLRNHEIEVSRESLICHGLRPRNDGAFEFKVVIANVREADSADFDLLQLNHLKKM